MAECAQLQYTPVTGPVWTEPVAEKLAWLPSGQPPARDRPPHRLGWYCRPEFEALYQPEGLQWTPEDSYSGRSPAQARLDWTVLIELVAAPPFDPQSLEWLPSGSQPQVPIERRNLGAFAQPGFAALYRPETLEWLAEQVYFGRTLPRAPLDWTVLQRPIVTAFDPSTLDWSPHGAARQLPVERRILGDLVQPSFDALYRPERLEWRVEQVYFGKVLARAVLDWTILQQPISAAFDPQVMDWAPRGNPWQAAAERRLLGAFAQPAFDALYRPERMEWALTGLQPARPLSGTWTGYWITDPTTPASAPVEIRITFELRADQSHFHVQADEEEFVAMADREKFTLN